MKMLKNIICLFVILVVILGGVLLIKINNNIISEQEAIEIAKEKIVSVFSISELKDRVYEVTYHAKEKRWEIKSIIQPKEGYVTAGDGTMYILINAKNGEVLSLQNSYRIPIEPEQ